MIKLTLSGAKPRLPIVEREEAATPDHPQSPTAARVRLQPSTSGGGGLRQAIVDSRDREQIERYQHSAIYKLLNAVKSAAPIRAALIARPADASFGGDPAIALCHAAEMLSLSVVRHLQLPEDSPTIRSIVPHAVEAISAQWRATGSVDPDRVRDLMIATAQSLNPATPSVGNGEVDRYAALILSGAKASIPLIEAVNRFAMLRPKGEMFALLWEEVTTAASQAANRAHGRNVSAEAALTLRQAFIGHAATLMAATYHAELENLLARPEQTKALALQHGTVPLEGMFARFRQEFGALLDAVVSPQFIAHIDPSNALGLQTPARPSGRLGPT